MHSFGKAIDSWQFGFIVDSLVELMQNTRRQFILRFQPIHLSTASLMTLGIYFSISQSTSVAPTSSSSLKGRVRTSGYSPRLSAFLATIRWAETGTSEPESYKKLVFNGTFNNFSTHPLKKQCAPNFKPI